MKPNIAQQIDNPRHILWIRTDSIGDNVMASSMLPAIAEKFPAARITVLCQEHIAELYAPCPYVDYVLAFNKTLAYTDAHYREVIIRRIQALDVDIAMNSVFSRELIGDIFTTRSGAKLRVGFLGDLCNITETHRSANNCYYTNLLPSGCRSSVPEMERHADFLKYFAIETPLQPAIWSTPEDERFADEFYSRHKLDTNATLAIAPGSQNDYKIYPLFSEVLEGFIDFTLILLGGMDTVNVAGAIFEKFKGTCHNLTGKCTLRQTAAIIRRCRCLLSSDSAAAHIAAAVATQNVVVLGGGHFGRFFPYSKFTTAVCLPLECYGCGWRCRYDEKYCINAISPELIVSALHSSLATPPVRPQIVAQGQTLWPHRQPLWQPVEKLINPALAGIETYDTLPKRPNITVLPPALRREAEINPNININAIVEKIKTSSQQNETLSLYEQYLDVVPYDLNAEQTANSLRLELLRRRLPKITIVTPSYNQGQYLEECILSILGQGYPNLEYIIMDGGSSDNSAEIIKKYEDRLAYSKSAPDDGQYAAINEGLKRATGDIMGWLNSDDKLHDGALWLVALVFSAMPEVQWIMGRPTVWGEDGVLSNVLTPLPLWSRQMYLEGRIGPPHIQQESVFWRRALWEAAGGHLDTSLKYAGDMELWARFFRFADLYSVDALIGGIRNHPAQKTAKRSSDDGYYDYADYNSEAGIIVAREADFYNQERLPLAPPVNPVSIDKAVQLAADSISAEGFALFTYSKQYHKAYFKNAGLPLTDDSIKGYRYNLVAAFAKSNIQPGGKVLFMGGLPPEPMLEQLAGRYELWAAGDEGVGTGLPAGVVYAGNDTTALPPNYFSLAVAVTPGEDQCNEIETLIKTGAFALLFFDVVVSENDVSVNAAMLYASSRPHTTHPPIDTSCMRLDPGALFFDDESGRKAISSAVLWKKTPCEVQQSNDEAQDRTLSPKHVAPIVSVISFAYHSHEFVEETLGDLANQTIGSAIELILVDSAATDNNQTMLQAQKIVKNTVLIYAPEGSSTTEMWNIALRASSGQFITHLPKHSRLGGEALEAMSTALINNPDAALVYGNTYLTTGASESFEFHHFCGIIQTPDSTYERLLTDSNLGPHPMWRKTVHEQIGYMDKWCERGLWLKIAERYNILHIPISTGLMRQGPDNVPIPPELEQLHVELQSRYCENLRQRLSSRPNVPLLIWGTGAGGHETMDILCAFSITVSGFIDSSPSKWHTKVKGLEVISVDELKEKIEAGVRPFIVISSMYCSEIRPVLEGLGYVSRENYWTNIFRFRYARPC
ncbi:MAG: glycosyltransferase [Candidatus Magnetominusculus sp. LBB02]|nr:glycosyltransferase [Candidatus Magnetominusculus sp. LBB02]